MKTKIFLIAFLIHSVIFSQTDSLNESLKYFPLNVGDYWQYKVDLRHIAGSDSIVETRFTNKEIIADTVLQNVKYFIRIDSSIYGGFRRNILRVDSTTGLVYKYNSGDEIIIDSLLANKNDTINYFYITDIISNNILGFETETKLYLPWTISSYDDYAWELSKNLGLTKMYHADKVSMTKYDYILVYAKINGNEYGTYVGLETTNILQSDFNLSQNYPNPFNPTTIIQYTIPSSNQNGNETVLLKVYNILGKEITTLVNEKQMSGNYDVTFVAKDLPSGIYFYKLQSGDFSSTEKMILLK